MAEGETDVAGDRRPLLSPAAKEALRLVFSPSPNYAQELLVEEAVATVGGFLGGLLGAGRGGRGLRGAPVV